MADRAAFSRARLAARRVCGWPLRRILDRRIEWILDALDERIGATPTRPSLHHRLDRLETELRDANRALGESLLDRRLASLAGETGETGEAELTLPGDTARFLEWADGHKGPAARAGLWFNPPVPVRYRENAADVLLVNERIVEQPYVFAALAGLTPPARILDVGGAESTIALSLASLGHEVHLVDPRGSRLEHPALAMHAMALDELPHALRFDAVVALSSIEHFGLGGYGQSGATARLDRAALADMQKRLVPGGTLVLTVPCAAVSRRDDFQRIYSVAQLREMLASWDLVDLSVVWRHDHLTWVRGLPDQPAGDIGVALITAQPQPTSAR
ncbi:MAG: class I SAM-dependent methyltransferase [Solirubrobacteraceae bacterium]